MNKRITARRISSVMTNGGGVDRREQVVFSGIPASIQSIVSGRETVKLAQEMVDVTTRVYTHADVSTLNTEDIITDDDSGARYEVLAVIDMAGMGRNWRISCRSK